MAEALHVPRPYADHPATFLANLLVASHVLGSLKLAFVAALLAPVRYALGVAMEEKWMFLGRRWNEAALQPDMTRGA